MDALRSFLPRNNTLYTLQNLLYLVLFVLLVAAIIPFFLLTFYAHPSADDFSYEIVYSTGNFWGHVVGEYLTWKGRYFAIFTTVLFHQSGDMFVNYKYPLLLFFTLLFFALYYLVRTIFEEKASFWQTLFSSLALGVFYITTLPKIQAVYWVDGAFQYQVGSIFYILSIASLLRLYREKESPLLPALTSMIFIFAAIGSTELAMISLTTLVGLMFLYKFFILKEHRLHWSAVLFVTISSSVLLVFAPGNAIRMELQPEDSNQFWFSTGRSIYHGAEILGDWLSNPTLWLLSITFIPVALYLVYMKNIRQDASWNRFYLILALLIGQIWACIFATWWAGATPAPGRTLNVIYLIFLIGWFIILLELVAIMAKSRNLVYIDRLFSIKTRVFMIISISLLCVSLVNESHVRDAYKDLSGRAMAYDRFMKERYAYIEKEKLNSKKGGLSLQVKMIPDPPRIVVYTDISRDKTDWRNSGYARYFGLSSIVTK